MADERTLFDFDGGPTNDGWRVVNDEVMGGQSTGQFREDGDGYARFCGDVSLEHNGGFASCRHEGDVFDLSQADALRLRVRGDGKTYGITLRSNGERDGIAYTSEIRTQADEWQEFTLPFSSFVPRSRGRFVEHAPPLTREAISSIGFVIGREQEGPFRLDVVWIKAARTAYPLASHLWKHRLVFLFAPSRLTPEFLEQSAELARHEAAMSDRDVVVIDAFEDREGRERGHALPPEQVAMLRDHFAIEPGEFSVVLVEKDGGEKLRANAPLRADDLIEAIDELPMRKRELADRGGSP